MNTEKKSEWLNVKNILVALVGIIVMYFIVTTLVDLRFQALEIATKVRISDQEALLDKIAEITARNGADSVTESIIKDCSVTERIQFDTLLGHLNNGLDKTELVELERLFGRCGRFFSDRKSVMVSRLSREVEIYSDYVDQLSTITGHSQTTSFPVGEWEALAKAERKQAEYSVELVRLQDAIISTLLLGKNAESEEINEILKQVQEVQTNLYEAKKATIDITNSLSSL
ncbi:hypothetical protein H6784_00515 [Candidatus Nomurabacteria bacterium]|nr:hypothetical protein [Candidatus Kaiserbacteria bacterium]MCB9813876.1 hypothetical protein [Candidatus Nomurabacteria bacterium]